MTVPKRVAVIAGYAPSLIRFRLELMKRMVDADHKVFALAPDMEPGIIDVLRSIRVEPVTVPMSRTGMNPVQDLRTLFSLWMALRKLKADLVMPYTMKPLIYGGIAARLARVPERCFLVTGLGYVFSDMDPSLKMSAVKQLSIQLYKLAFASAKVVFVYNAADDADIRNNKIIGDTSRIVLVAGSGVDLGHYTRSDVPEGPTVFLLIARLLRDKGIVEFVEAARIIRRKLPDVRFQIVGQFDPNPTAISPDEMHVWEKEGIIEFLGETQDVRPYLAKCSVFVLPSFYREGIPRSILEAMATGRAIITTDLPGCRDTIEEGVNGYAIASRDAKALAAKMEILARDAEKIRRMGQKSFEIARDRFDVHAVNRHLLTHMGLI